MKSRILALLAMGSLASATAGAAPVTLDFTGLTNDLSANNEPGIAGALAIASGAGLTLTTTGTFNVGCGGGSNPSCLGADASFFNDFSGFIQGVFSGPTSVLDIAFVNASDPPTTTRLYDASNNLIATLLNSFSYSGVDISRFTIQLDLDGFTRISFNNQAAVPEPGTLALLGLGLAGLGLIRRRRAN